MLSSTHMRYATHKAIGTRCTLRAARRTSCWRACICFVGPSRCCDTASSIAASSIGDGRSTRSSDDAVAPSRARCRRRHSRRDATTVAAPTSAAAEAPLMTIGSRAAASARSSPSHGNHARGSTGGSHTAGSTRATQMNLFSKRQHKRTHACTPHHAPHSLTLAARLQLEAYGPTPHSADQDGRPAPVCTRQASIVPRVTFSAVRRFHAGEFGYRGHKQHLRWRLKRQGFFGQNEAGPIADGAMRRDRRAPPRARGARAERVHRAAACWHRTPSHTPPLRAP